MKREEVLKIAQREHKGVGRVISEVPTKWSCGESCTDCNGVEVFHFGVYWNDWPESLGVVSYGPNIIFKEDGSKGYDLTQYVCWAS